MLFVACMKADPETSAERNARRLEWDYPEGGARVIGEYWLQTNDPSVVAVVEADHIGQIMLSLGDWSDLFEISVFPAITAADGLELLKTMNQE